MKKKIATLLITTAVLCTSATSVFAAEIPQDSQVEVEIADEGDIVILESGTIDNVTANEGTKVTGTEIHCLIVGGSRRVNCVSIGITLGKEFANYTQMTYGMNGKMCGLSPQQKAAYVPGKEIKVAFPLGESVNDGDNKFEMNIDGKPLIVGTVNVTLINTDGELNGKINSSSFKNVMTEPNQDIEDNDNQGSNFADVPANKWYAPAVNYVYSKKIMSGVGDGRLFAPDNQCTREMMVKILHNAAGNPAVEGSSSFNDVKKGSWYENAVTWAVKNGITNGKSSSSFGVGENVTREQVACFLYNYAKFCGKCDGAEADLNKFKDVGNISGFAKAALAWANKHDIVKGNSDGTLNPKGSATRAEIAQMVTNYMKNVN